MSSSDSDSVCSLSPSLAPSTSFTSISSGEIVSVKRVEKVIISDQYQMGSSDYVASICATPQFKTVMSPLYSTALSTLRPSPSMSTLVQKPTGLGLETCLTFGAPPPKPRANSLSNTTKPPEISIPSENYSTLAERRQSQTSRYLGTDDFKSAFAINLQKLKIREKNNSCPTTALLQDSTPKSDDSVLSDGSPAIVGLKSPIQNSASTVAAKNISKTKQSTPMSVSPANFATSPLRLEEVGLSQKVVELMNLPSHQLAKQLELHFSQPGSAQDPVELEARNEVIATLADQLSTQLELNDKLLFELGSVRAAHASLQSRVSDYMDELEFLRKRHQKNTEEAERLRGVDDVETNEKVKELRHSLEESKKVINQLRSELRNQDRRQNFQNYQLFGFQSASRSADDGLDSGNILRRSNTVEFTPKNRAEPTRSIPAHSHRFSMGNAVLTNYGMGTEEGVAPQFGGPLAFPPFIPLSPGLDKPARPEKNAARFRPASTMVGIKPTGNVSLGLPKLASFGEVRPTAKVGFESLETKCCELKAKLKESEDARISLQTALDSLRCFISNNHSENIPVGEPPATPAVRCEEALKTNAGNFWGIPSFVARSLQSKVLGSEGEAGSPPTLAFMSPALGGHGFGNFGMWAKSPFTHL